MYQVQSDRLNDRRWSGRYDNGSATDGDAASAGRSITRGTAASAARRQTFRILAAVRVDRDLNVYVVAQTPLRRVRVVVDLLKICCTTICTANTTTYRSYGV